MPPDPAADTLIDGRGRTIALRDLSIPYQMRLMRLLGGADPALYRMCLGLAHVASIDGRALPAPGRPRAFETIARRLGPDGVVAVVARLADRAGR